MHGDTTGLESADTSSPGDAEAGPIVGPVERPSVEEVAKIHDWLCARAEWQTARGLVDAWERSKSETREG